MSEEGVFGNIGKVQEPQKANTAEKPQGSMALPTGPPDLFAELTRTRCEAMVTGAAPFARFKFPDASGRAFALYAGADGTVKVKVIDVRLER